MQAVTEKTEANKRYQDYEINVVRPPAAPTHRETFASLLIYLFMGIFFGIILVKSEVISWFRIQEMFRLQSFHMYGIIGSAILVGMLSVWVIRKFDIRTIHGEKVDLSKKSFHKGQVYGGLLFGFGWAMTGACPGPLYALIGSGFTVIIVPLLFAIAGTYAYALLERKLPH